MTHFTYSIETEASYIWIHTSGLVGIYGRYEFANNERVVLLTKLLNEA